MLIYQGFYLHVCRKEAVTLPEKQDTETEDVEQLLQSSNTTAAVGFQQTAYFSMVRKRPPIPK